ncbi:MAG: ABC transporter permease [Niabella sp.]|nr:ABC transporter permease [Niabella sp.]
MIKNYFKTAFRNLWKSKGFTAINILGLAIGMAAALLILLWIENELSMDRFHAKGDRIYWMYNRDRVANESWAWGNTSAPLAPALKKDYPEVEDVARVLDAGFLFTVGEKKMNAHGLAVDSGFLSMFSFPMLQGDVRQSLKSVYDIVITEKLAKKLFGKENALGKTIRIDSVNNCTVTGVLKDLPPNTQFDFEYLLPLTYVKKLGWFSDNDNWGNNWPRTFVLLRPNSSQKAFDAKVRTITIDHTKNDGNPSTTEVFTQPLNRAYLYGKPDNGKLVSGQMQTVIMFGIIAAFILLIACINFMNLSTARSEKRAREVGIRKVAGAERKTLVFQFLTESILLSFIAFLIALILVQVSLGWFNQLTNKQLFIQYRNGAFWLSALAFVVFTGILAGSYPAFYLSSFNPVKVLKGAFKKVKALVAPRKILVVTQFTFAIFMIIATIIIVKQLEYGLSRDKGYNQNNLVYVRAQGNINKHYAAIKNELLGSGAVTMLTKSANAITQRNSDSWGFKWNGSTKDDEKIDFVKLGTDADFAKTFDIALLKGRDIDVYKYPTDTNAVLLNETAIKMMRLKDPVGTIIREVGDTSKAYVKVVGVVKDFILESPFSKKVSPMMIFCPTGNFAQVIHLKLNPENTTADNLGRIEPIFKKYNPQYPFEYTFVDEDYSKKFTDIQRQRKLAELFAGLTIFISCLGLFALAAYMAENRIKEIGVRKVLGASVLGISSLLSKDFLKLVMVAFLIAAPLAWWLMNKWLAGYTYRINIEWWVFVLAGMLSVFIALVTVSFQSIKAAIANPVKALRSE